METIKKINMESLKKWEVYIMIAGAIITGIIFYREYILGERKK